MVGSDQPTTFPELKSILRFMSAALEFQVKVSRHASAVQIRPKAGKILPT